MCSSGIVNVVTLDTDLARLGLNQIGFVKIDAERSEPAILHGMEQTMHSSPDLRLVLEMNGSGLRAAGVEPRQLVDQLREYGSDPKVILDAGGLSQPDASAPTMTVNLLCARQDR